ncbi:uncharacterized protein [Ptychodera flava]|uniref:uncharacterized protein n=1 Tax=Ptychodera flava TaxID=63121 RepID=UPI00396AAFCD
MATSKVTIQEMGIPLTITMTTSLTDDDKVMQLVSQRLRHCGTVHSRKVVNSVPTIYSERMITMRFKLISSSNKSQNHSQVEDFTNIRRLWCRQPPRADFSQPWLSADSRLLPGKDSKEAVHSDIDVKKLSFGVLLNRGTYVSHFESDDQTDIDLTIEHDRRELNITLANGQAHVRGQSNSYKFTVAYSDLENILLVDDKESALYLHIWLKCPPRLNQSEDDIRISWQRTINFPGCTSHVIGKSSVIRLTFSDTKSRVTIHSALSRLHQRYRFKVHYCPIRVLLASSLNFNDSRKPTFDSFECNYALECLLSRDFRVDDQLGEFFPTLNKYRSETLISKALYQVATDIDRNLFIDINRAFETSFRDYAVRLGSESDSDEGRYVPDTCRYVRRLVVTPSRQIFLQSQLMFENRILREFGEEYCLRVVFRDENYQKLTCQVSSEEEIERRIISILRSGVKVSGRKYEFLACSNSQLKDHGCWLYAADEDGNKAADIRQWMGDFSRLKCVATYIARMGQCFSKTEESIAVTIEEGTVSHIEDIKGGLDNKGKPYCFSDGVGKISKSLAKKICEQLKRSVIPSAYQIRYGGCKGVVAIDTTLEGDKMEIRESMSKFASDHSKIEIMKTASPGRLFLNRQAITLLSGMGVPDKVFLELQHDLLRQLAQMFLSKEAAVKSLTKRSHVSINFKELHRCGVNLTTEPFFQGMLQAVYKTYLGEIRRRARIEIPPEYGRNMLGVLDETRKLKYGQVFVQYSENLSRVGKALHIHTGTVVVTKFPCHHPGDVRKFEAVDVAELHHMVDCIVFPCQGSRSHPNEMAGSDLDGDEYFVTWHPKLIFPRKNYPPMHFPTPCKTYLDREVELDDMIKFVAEYIQNDNLGFMSNAHLVKADSESEGIFSPICIEMAELLAEAVDFAKTGHCPKLEKEHIPMRYPDFMAKTDKTTYRSDRCLGKLFRQCQAVERATIHKLRQGDGKADDSIGIVEVEPDHSLLYSYSTAKKYLKSATTSRDRYNHQLELLMSQYGVKSEAEALSGCVASLDKRIMERNERYDSENVIREKIKRLRKVTRDEFYDEFQNEDVDTQDSADDDDIVQRESEILAKASAWYYVTYSQKNPKYVSFPWVVSDLLGKIKSKSFAASSHGPVTKIDEQLIAGFVGSSKELAIRYLNVQDGSIESVHIKNTLVAYPILLPVVDIILKWAEAHDLTHGGSLSMGKMTRNDLIGMMLNFAVQNHYIKYEDHTGYTTENKWQRLFHKLTRDPSTYLAGSTLERETPGHLLVNFLDFCSQLQYDNTLLTTNVYDVFNSEHLINEQIYSLGEKALSSFHHLAQTGDANTLTKGWLFEYQEEWNHELSPSCWFLLNKQLSVTKIMRDFEDYTGATVTLRRLFGIHVKGPERGKITAYGTVKSLEKIADRVYYLEHTFGNKRFRYLRGCKLPPNFFTDSFFFPNNQYTHQNHLYFKVMQ